MCLVALVLIGTFCDAQGQWPSKPKYQNQKTQEPTVPQQSKQTFNQPLKWAFPVITDPEPGPPVPFQLRSPVPAKTVAVECREKDAHVEVKKDFFGIGQFINPADLTLGSCGAVAEDSGAQVLIYEADLHECGSVSRVSAMKNASY